MPRPSRRTFLRAAGAVVGLPALDAETPAFAAAPGSPRRLFAVQTNMGILPEFFFPKSAGKDYDPPPYLEILKAHRERMTVFGGVSHPDVDGAHEAEISFLTAAPHPGTASFKNSISVDQLAAERIGHATRFPSFTLQVSTEGGKHTLSYTRSGVGIPPVNSPAAVYRKMFVQGTPEEVEARVADLGVGRSVLDFVGDGAKRLEKSVGPADRDKLDQYFTAVRDLEKQLHAGQAWERKPKPPAPPGPPVADVPDGKKLIARTKAMFDLARLAFATDSTRLVTLFINTSSIVPELPGVKHETHSLTHHGGRPETIAELKTIETAQFRVLNDLLDGLAAAKDGVGSLLDSTAVLYGTCMGSANSHANTNLPVLLAGGAFKHAGFLDFDRKKNYPLPNLFVSLLQQHLGLPIDRFASGTATVRGLDAK